MTSISRSKILIKNTSWIYVAKFITQFLGIIVSIFVIRKLSIEEYGTFNFLVASFIGFQVIALQPIQSILNRYIPELSKSNNNKLIINFLLKSFFFSSLIMISLIICFVIFQKEYGNIFNIINFDNYFLSFLLYLTLRFLYTFLSTTISALLLQKELSLMKIVKSLFQILLYKQDLTYW